MRVLLWLLIALTAGCEKGAPGRIEFYFADEPTPDTSVKPELFRGNFVAIESTEEGVDAPMISATIRLAVPRDRVVRLRSLELFSSPRSASVQFPDGARHEVIAAGAADFDRNSYRLSRFRDSRLVRNGRMFNAIVFTHGSTRDPTLEEVIHMLSNRGLVDVAGPK